MYYSSEIYSKSSLARVYLWVTNEERIVQTSNKFATFSIRISNLGEIRDDFAKIIAVGAAGVWPNNMIIRNSSLFFRWQKRTHSLTFHSEVFRIHMIIQHREHFVVAALFFLLLILVFLHASLMNQVLFQFCTSLGAFALDFIALYIPR